MVTRVKVTIRFAHGGHERKGSSLPASYGDTGGGKNRYGFNDSHKLPVDMLWKDDNNQSSGWTQRGFHDQLPWTEYVMFTS